MNKKLSIAGAAVMLLFLIATSAIAQAQVVPDLSSDELRRLIDQTPDLLVIDTRTDQEFNGGHIAGAIHISSPASNQFRTLAGMLPEDKRTPLVFYCRGYNWGLAPEAAVVALQAGYLNVYTYRAGMSEWLQKGYPVSNHWLDQALKIAGPFSAKQVPC